MHNRNEMNQPQTWKYKFIRSARSFFGGRLDCNICMNVFTYVCIYIEGPPSRMRFSYADAAPKAGLVAASFEHKPTDSQTHSPLPNCEETNCNGLCLGRHVAGRQARGAEPPCGQTARMQCYPKLHLPWTSSPHVNKGLRTSGRRASWLRSSNPACK